MRIIGQVYRAREGLSQVYMFPYHSPVSICGQVRGEWLQVLLNRAAQRIPREITTFNLSYVWNENCPNLVKDFANFGIVSELINFRRLLFENLPREEFGALFRLTWSRMPKQAMLPESIILLGCFTPPTTNHNLTAQELAKHTVIGQVAVPVNPID